MDVDEFLHSGLALKLDKPVGNGPLCIVDSSFNPPNFAHIKLAQLGLEQVPNSTVVFLLATGNADKPAASTTQLTHRAELMRRAALYVDPTGSRVRVGLTTAPFFIDKALAFHNEFNANRLLFIVGYDTLVRFVDQKYYKEPVSQVLDRFFDISEMMVLTRYDESIKDKIKIHPKAQTETAEKLVGKHQSKVHFVLSQDDTAEVSSSRARTSLQDLEACCPPSVVEYVQENNLYS